MKERITLTIDKRVLNKFRDYCKKNSMKISTKVNDLMKEDME